MKTSSVLAFDIYGAIEVQKWLRANPCKVFDIVRSTYVTYHSGKAESPDSFFLRFNDDPHSRIIALPATLEDQKPVAGIKWVASFPRNLEQGLDRASAIVIVNDRKTGYPIACLEGSLISAARTAASAAVGVEYLHPAAEGNKYIARLGVVGCGPIALASVNLLHDLGWKIGQLKFFDEQKGRVQKFMDKLNHRGIQAIGTSLETVISSSDVIIFATSAVVPHINSHKWLAHCPTIVHLSLRDLAPCLIRSAQNVADDIDHCVKANTSLHLTEQEDGNRDFIQLNISDFISGRAKPNYIRPRIYSPFGMGILDLAVARAVIDDENIRPVVSISNFFPPPFSQSA